MCCCMCSGHAMPIHKAVGMNPHQMSKYDKTQSMFVVSPPPKSQVSTDYQTVVQACLVFWLFCIAVGGFTHFFDIAL